MSLIGFEQFGSSLATSTVLRKGSAKNKKRTGALSSFDGSLCEFVAGEPGLITTDCRKHVVSTIRSNAGSPWNKENIKPHHQDGSRLFRHSSTFYLCSSALYMMDAEVLDCLGIALNHTIVLCDARWLRNGVRDILIASTSDLNNEFLEQPDVHC